VRGSADFLRLAFQNPHDRTDCVPISCRGRHAEQFVDLAEIADRFHVTTVHSEDESAFRSDESHEPLATCRKRDWNGGPETAGFRQDADESNHVRACGLRCKRILHLQANKIAAVAEHNLRFKWQLPEQFSTELCSRSRFTNDKRAGGADIHDIKVIQFFGEDAWAKRSMSADIDTSEENNESHAQIIKKKRVR
jgi:hypothetical protein